MADEVPKTARVSPTNREHDQRQIQAHVHVRPQGAQPFRGDYPINVNPRPPGGYAYQEKLQEARRAGRPKSTPPRQNRYHDRDVGPILMSFGEEPKLPRSPSAPPRSPTARKSPPGRKASPPTRAPNGNPGQQQNRYTPEYRGPPPTRRHSPPENPRVNKLPYSKFLVFIKDPTDPKQKAYNAKTANFGPRLQPILKDEEWRKYPEVQVHIGPGVPATVGLRTILAEFRQYGSMEYMSYDSGMVKIRMSDVHIAFWDKGVITLESGAIYPIKLLKQMTNFFHISSPVDHNKFYSDRFVSRPSIYVAR